MRPSSKKLVDRLQIGWYLLRVDEFDRASALPITSQEAAMFMKNVIGRARRWPSERYQAASWWIRYIPAGVSACQ